MVENEQPVNFSRAVVSCYRSTGTLYAFYKKLRIRGSRADLIRDFKGEARALAYKSKLELFMRSFDFM